MMALGEHPEQIAVEAMAEELYGVMKRYSDSLDGVGDDPNFRIYADEDDEFKGLMRALALHVLRLKG